ncbi:MAG: hypothetical protein Q7T71_07100 [Herbiconiux sp.]|nr:hypothetical protein [Herbiconiux sp.]
MTDISRRTALQAAAWSAPVIALAAATPAVSASNGIAFTGSSAVWTTANGRLDFETHVLLDGEPASGQDVTFTLVPSGVFFTTISYGDDAVARSGTFDAPVDTTAVTISAGGESASVTVTGVAPPPSNYTFYQAYGGWNTVGAFALEVYVRNLGVPAQDVPVLFTLLPSETELPTATIGSEGYARQDVASPPLGTTHYRVESGDCVRTYEVTGTPLP